MTVPFVQTEMVINLASGAFDVRDIGPDEGIYGPVDYGWQAYKKDRDVFTFGEGLLASSAIPGSRRLIFCAWSPQWESFYISTMGGAAYAFQHVGVNYVSLTGRCDKPSVLLLNNDGKTPSVRLEPLESCADIWRGYKDPDGEDLIGIYALQQAIFDKWAGEYHPRRVRMFVVGPAADATQEGAIASNTIKKERFLPVVDWCGRGGLGSRLLQQHNIVGCIFGGDWMDPHASKWKDVDPYFLEHFGKKGVKVDMAATVKYAYDPKLETGGTFGSNYVNIKEGLLTFNYRSTFASKDERRRQHKGFILDHYLKQFNEETIKGKHFDHCGEPCSVACKKLNGKYKKDYEPYHALGPQVGVFDQRAAELLNDHADAMGMDAIQIGGTLAWIMECVADKLIEPEKFGFPPASGMKFQQFTADTAEFDVVEDSMRNARYAMALIDAIMTDKRATPFRKGIRLAAYAMNGLYPDAHPGDRAVYLAHGEEGHMVPNQYFVPGMGSPMPLMGKYYVYYGKEFLSPDDLGRKNVERMVYELANDNCGICRFHRQWSESLVPEIIKKRFGIDLDFKAHHFQMAKEINDHEHGKAIPWETQRMVEMLFNYLSDWQEGSTEGDKISFWMEREDRMLTAQAFWQMIMNGQQTAFRAGPDAVTDALTPKQMEERLGL